MKNWYHNLQVTAAALLVIAVVASIAYGAWSVERWYKYKFGYQGKVQEELQPLQKRMDDFDQRLREIEKKLEKK